MNVTVSKHAQERAAQRMQMPRMAALAHAQAAWDYGKVLDDFTGKTRKWLEDRLKPTQGARIVCVLDGVAYFFSGHVCVTVIPLPKEKVILPQ